METSGCWPFERSLNHSIKVADLWSAVQTAGMHINVPLPRQPSKDGGGVDIYGGLERSPFQEASLTGGLRYLLFSHFRRVHAHRGAILRPARSAFLTKVSPTKTRAGREGRREEKKGAK